MAGPSIGIVVLDTGYNGPHDDRIYVEQRDYCHRQAAIDMGGLIVPGYTPRPDGSDSVVNGHGTRACRKIVELLSSTGIAFRVFSAKIGDSAAPLLGVSPSAAPAGLEWAYRLHAVYPNWSWVVYIDFDITALGLYPSFGAYSSDVPLVIPTGANALNVDLLTDTHGTAFPSLIPPHVLVVAGPDPNTDYGQHTIGLAVPDDLAGPVAAAWVAYSRHVLPGAGAAVVRRVRSVTQPVPAWAGRSMTGGILTGPVR